MTAKGVRTRARMPTNKKTSREHCNSSQMLVVAQHWSWRCVKILVFDRVVVFVRFVICSFHDALRATATDQCICYVIRACRTNSDLKFHCTVYMHAAEWEDNDEMLIIRTAVAFRDDAKSFPLSPTVQLEHNPTLVSLPHTSTHIDLFVFILPNNRIKYRIYERSQCTKNAIVNE